MFVYGQLGHSSRKMTMMHYSNLDDVALGSTIEPVSENSNNKTVRENSYCCLSFIIIIIVAIIGFTRINTVGASNPAFIVFDDCNDR